MVRMGRDTTSHKMHSYTETSEFKRDGFCFHLERDIKSHFRQYSYFWLSNDLFTGRKKDIASQSCISWDGFKILRSLERKKGIIYSFLRIKRSRLWAKCYTGPLWGRESHALQEVKRKDNRPSVAVHLRAGDGTDIGECSLWPWGQYSREYEMAPTMADNLSLSPVKVTLKEKWDRKKLMGLTVVSLTWNSMLIKRGGRAWVRPVSCISAWLREAT